MAKSVTVSVPASLTNLGAGFDALGLAVSVEYRIRAAQSTRGLTIHISGEGEHSLPRDRTNFTYRVMEAAFRRMKKRPKGLVLYLENRIPIGRGMGSSAACVVGGIVAANALMNGKLSEAEILRLAIELEGHPDNVLPALVGGFTVAAMKKGEVHYSRQTLAPSIYVVLVVPAGEVLTKKARGVLPKHVPFGDAVFNVGRSALTVAALTQKKLELLNVSTEDRLHQPYRRKLFPSLTQFLDVIQSAGGFGACVSGSGPTAITFVEGKDAANRVAGRIRSELKRKHLKAGVWVVRSVTRGAQIIK